MPEDIRKRDKMSDKMFGILKSKPAKGLEIRDDLPIPSIGPGDILVRVRAAAICGTDRHIYEWTDYAKKRVPLPMVFGHEFAGDVVAVGSGVTGIKEGDKVAGETHIPCNDCEMCRTDNRHICENMKIIGVHVPGAFAEYIAFPADCAYKFDEGLTYEYASMLEPLGVAVHGVDRAEVKGKTVVIFGCGPIGLMAVGAAKCMGAKRVYAADIQDRKLDAAKEMGAFRTVNTKNGSVLQALAEEHDSADVVIDYTGSIPAVRAGIDTVKKGGRLVLVGLPSESMTIDLTNDIIYKELTVVGVTGRLMYKTWRQCDELLKNEKFDISVAVGGVYPMKEIEKAFEQIEEGTPGKMILIP